jgi:flagellar motor switch protein FliM
MLSPKASILQPGPAVRNAGLSALLETYGLKREELHHVKLLSERLFDELRESLTELADKPVKMEHLAQEVRDASDFCAQPNPHHFTVLGFDDEPVVILRMELPLAAALVAAGLGGEVPDSTAGQAAAPSALTPIETRVLAHTVSDLFIGSVERALGHLFPNRQGLRLICSSERPAAVIERCQASEQLVAASTQCAIGGVSATLAFAIPLSIVVQVRARLVPTRQQRRFGTLESEKTQTALAAARLELSAVLGSVAVSLDEIKALGPGSLVLLRKLSEEVPRVSLRCSQHTLFFGTVVRDGGWYRFLVESRGDNNGNPGTGGEGR